MKDTEGKKRRKRPDEQPPEASPDSPEVSYTPEQRRMIRNGLRIWARVAIRSYMRKHGAALSLPEAAPGRRRRGGGTRWSLGTPYAVPCRGAVYFTVRYPVMETGVRSFSDEHGNEVRLTDERLRHILRRHPEMAFQMRRFADTLARPDAVRPSRSTPTVQLYYRLYPDLRGRNRYLCLVVKRERTYSFILTAYLSRSIKGE